MAERFMMDPRKPRLNCSEGSSTTQIGSWRKPKSSNKEMRGSAHDCTRVRKVFDGKIQSSSSVSLYTAPRCVVRQFSRRVLTKQLCSRGGAGVKKSKMIRSRF